MTRALIAAVACLASCSPPSEMGQRAEASAERAKLLAIVARLPPTPLYSAPLQPERCKLGEPEYFRLALLLPSLFTAMPPGDHGWRIVGLASDAMRCGVGSVDDMERVVGAYEQLQEYIAETYVAEDWEDEPLPLHGSSRKAARQKALVDFVEVLDSVAPFRMQEQCAKIFNGFGSAAWEAHAKLTPIIDVVMDHRRTIATFEPKDHPLSHAAMAVSYCLQDNCHAAWWWCQRARRQLADIVNAMPLPPPRPEPEPEPAKPRRTR